jgi:AraC family transcriptional regulator
VLRKLEPGGYFGSSREILVAGGLRVARTAFDADLEIPAHEHVNPFFCLVVNGHGLRSWPGRSGHEAPMALTLFPAGIPHANAWHGDGGRAVHIEFSPDWLKSFGADQAFADLPTDYRGGPPMAIARRLSREAEGGDDLSVLATQGLMLELIAACARLKPESTARMAPSWLKRVDELLADRYTERLTLEQIAAVAGVSADHVAREFRRNHQRTIGDELRRLRIDAARRRLRSSDASLPEIALSVGFADQSHFGRAFLRETGLTPAAFRQAQQRRIRSKA